MRWYIENFMNILLLIITSLICVGTLIEFVARFIPTEKPDSVISQFGAKMGKFGSGLVTLGDHIKGLLDFLKVPNRLK